MIRTHYSPNPQLHETITKYNKAKSLRKQCQLIKDKLECSYNYQKRSNESLQLEIKHASEDLVEAEQNHARHMKSIYDNEMHKDQQAEKREELRKHIQNDRKTTKYRLRLSQKAKYLSKKQAHNQIKFGLRKMNQLHSITLAEIDNQNKNKIAQIHRNRQLSALAVTNLKKQKMLKVQRDYHITTKFQEMKLSRLRVRIQELQTKNKSLSDLKQKNSNFLSILKSKIHRVCKSSFFLTIKQKNYSGSPSQIILSKSTKTSFQ